MPDLANSRVFKTEYAGRELVVEIGKYAEQANGACLVRCGDTAVHVSVCMSETAREGMDFFPLSVDYEEKMFAVGKIPGGFKKAVSRRPVSSMWITRTLSSSRDSLTSRVRSFLVVSQVLLSSSRERWLRQ